MEQRREILEFTSHNRETFPSEIFLSVKHECELSQDIRCVCAGCLINMFFWVRIACATQVINTF
jgi:hypothetical protein